MAGGYTVGIASETKAFKQGIESGVIDPLEDAQKELLELGKNRGPEQLERALKDAENATDRLKDETKDTARAIEQEYRDSYRKLKSSSDDGIGHAKEGVQDFKQEAQQSARETAASFDGSFESIADFAQEVAANAFSGFGPAGTAAGLAIAAGLGVAVDQFNKIDEASKDALQSAYDFAYGIGAAFDAADKVSAVASWTSDQEKFKQVLDLTAASGWDQVDVIDALVEGGTKLDSLTQAYADGANAAGLTVGRMQELDAVLPSIEKGLDEGAEAARAQAEYLYKLSQDAGQATGEVDALGNTIVKLPGDVEVSINAETKTATTDIQRVEDKVNNLPDGHSNVRVTADTSDVDRAMRRISGTTLKIGAKVVTSGPGWDR